ncbi:MAG: response regulator [Desulfobacter sp.]
MALARSHKPHEHRVLIVDDEPAVGKTIRRTLGKMDVKSTYAETGEAGLECIDHAEQPFSLIISDQRMPGIQGTEFLARAKEITPDTIRFLITAYSEMATIISAVNTGAVQHYISKPWDHDELVKAIRMGLRLYENYLESQHLFSLAKKQNAKLYGLNRELMETGKNYEKERRKLEMDIRQMAAQLPKKGENTAPGPSEAVEKIRSFIEDCDGSKQEALNSLCETTLADLYGEFYDLALRNGIEMPEPVARGSHD